MLDRYQGPMVIFNSGWAEKEGRRKERGKEKGGKKWERNSDVTELLRNGEARWEGTM